MKTPMEARDRRPPRMKDVHTIEECDAMLKLSLEPAVADAWLDERLSCMKMIEVLKRKATESD